MKVSAKYVNPFIEAAMSVVRQVAGIDVRRGHLSYMAKVDPSYRVSIIIGVYGYLVGQIVYSFDDTLAEYIVDKLLSGKSLEEKKMMFVDTLGELANMITGNATSLLNHSKEVSLQITTPAIAMGERLAVSLVPKPALVLGLYTLHGKIEISVALEEHDVLPYTDEAEPAVREDSTWDSWR